MKKKREKGEIFGMKKMKFFKIRNFFLLRILGIEDEDQKKRKVLWGLAWGFFGFRGSFHGNFQDFGRLAEEILSFDSNSGVLGRPAASPVGTGPVWPGW